MLPFVGKHLDFQAEDSPSNLKIKFKKLKKAEAKEPTTAVPWYLEVRILVRIT